MTWDPHITVATVVVKEDRFLLVEEEDSTGNLVFNQPAGHLEAQETLVAAAEREVLEETAWEVKVSGLLGLALYTAPSNGVTYYRTSFIATPIREIENHPLDTGIHRAVWLSYDEVLNLTPHMRSPLVIKTIDQYRAGHSYPLSMIYHND